MGSTITPLSALGCLKRHHCGDGWPLQARLRQLQPTPHVVLQRSFERRPCFLISPPPPSPQPFPLSPTPPPTAAPPAVSTFACWLWFFRESRSRVTSTRIAVELASKKVNHAAILPSDLSCIWSISQRSDAPPRLFQMCWNYHISAGFTLWMMASLFWCAN